MEEDLKNLQLDKPGRGKTIEQLKKHTLDAAFDNKPIERGLFLLTKGDDIQKLSVIQALPQLLQYDPQATFSRILPKIQQELPNSSCEFHVATSKIFRLLMERQVPVNLLHAVLQSIESRDPIVSNAWMETLLGVIPILTEAQVKNEIIPIAFNKSHLNYPTNSRVASCKILGRIAVHQKMEPLDVKKDILPLVHSLCQDCHPEVRATMCTQLPCIAQGLGSNLVKINLLPSLVELAADDHMSVRAAAVVSVVMMFPFLTVDVKKSTIIPLVKQLCERSLNEDDLTAAPVAKEFGKLLEGFQSCLSIADSNWFLQCYKKLAHRGLAISPRDLHLVDASQDVLCRQQCAANLPSVAFFTLNEIPGQIDVMYSVFHDLAADPCYIVRRTVAAGIHEVTRILGAQNRIIKADLVRLLRDDAEEVLQTLVPHLGNTLELLCTYGTISRETATQATVEIGRAILKCQIELTKGINWRLLTHFLHQLEHLPACMPSDFIHQHFTPIVLSSAISGRAKPVRSQATRTLLMFLRYNAKETHRKWLRDNLITQLCYSKSCYTRHIYVRLCVHAMDIFSDKYFKEYFYLPLVSLADDPVSNIRLCVVSLLPGLKQMLNLPEDRRYKTLIDNILTKLENHEKDRDVMENLRIKIREMNLSSSILSKEEHATEERRRQEEEERVTFGRILPPIARPTTSSTKTHPSSVAINAPSSNKSFSTKSSPLQRSLSVPRRSTSAQSQPSDMNFLEQHFYIDAGISLTPTAINKDNKLPLTQSNLANNFDNKLRLCDSESINIKLNNDSCNENNLNETVEVSTVSVDNTDIEKLSENDLKLLQNITSNITDDIKVNLRKINQKENSPDFKTIDTRSDYKNKRHSSVFSVSCVNSDITQRKKINRRSLNITARDTGSKIPVCQKIAKHNTDVENNSHIVKRNTDKKIKTSDVNCIKSSSSRDVLSAKFCEIGDGNDKVEENTGNTKNTSKENDTKLPSFLPVYIKRTQSEVRK